MFSEEFIRVVESEEFFMTQNPTPPMQNFPTPAVKSFMILTPTAEHLKKTSTSP